MTLIRKDTPGSAPGGYEWSGPDDEVDVPRELAADLVHLPDGDFHEVGADLLPEPEVPNFAPPGDGTTEPVVTEPVVPMQEPITADTVTEDPTQIVEPTPVPQHLVTEPGPEPTVTEDKDKPFPTKKADLVDLARELGLSTEGTNAHLTKRIKAHQAKH